LEFLRDFVQKQTFNWKNSAKFLNQIVRERKRERIAVFDLLCASTFRFDFDRNEQASIRRGDDREARQETLSDLLQAAADMEEYKIM
jgi:hypothetical protein